MSVERYREFRRVLKVTPFKGKFMPYDWSGLPDTLPIRWMAYAEMWSEFSREIANSINDLSRFTHRLAAWETVVSGLNDKQRFDLAHEFVDPLATLALNLPYVVRSRLIFATTHLCHQANSGVKDTSWIDELPLDEDIYFGAADGYGKGWKRYPKLKTSLEGIAGKDFREGTDDFRNSYNHRFSRRIVIGQTRIVRRSIDPKSKAVTYGFGGTEPMTLKTVVELLGKQCERCYKAFEAFQRLVAEHETAIKLTLKP